MLFFDFFLALFLYLFLFFFLQSQDYHLLYDRETGRYQVLLFHYQMHINSYLFSDHGSDEEERWSDIRRTSSDAERRGAGKDLPFSHIYFTLTTSCH